MKMPHMLNVQAAPTAEAGAEAAAPAAGDWRQFCWVMVQIVFLIVAQKVQPPEMDQLCGWRDARSHVDHLHFLDVLASRPSRPRKRAKGKGVWILSAWSPSEPIIDLSASGRVDDSFLLWPLRYLSLTPYFWVQIDLGTQTGSFPSSQ